MVRHGENDHFSERQYFIDDVEVDEDALCSWISFRKKKRCTFAHFYVNNI